MSDAPEWVCSLEAEASVIGALLTDNAAYDRIADLIRPADFYLDRHRMIYLEAVRLIEQGKAADIITVDERVRRAHAGKDAGGIAYLTQLLVNTPSAHGVRRWAEIIRERAILRGLHVAARNIQERIANTEGREVAQLLDEAQEALLALGESSVSGRGDFKPLQELLPQTMERVDEQYQRFQAGQANEVTGLATGFRDLDKLTSGLHSGQLIVIAGRPSMGKTALALNMAEHIASASQMPLPFFSMEMGSSEQVLRLLAANSGVNMQRLASGRIYDPEWSRISDALGRLATVPLVFNEAGGLSMSEVRAMARRAQREHGRISAVVLDYLQLMRGDGNRHDNRATEVSEISRGLKALAKELQVPVIALSQLNRDLEKRADKRPVMSDLRESGAIEQDADVIMFIYRDEVYNPDSPDRGMAELIIGKQRNGPPGTVRLMFDGAHTRFTNFRPRHGAPEPVEALEEHQ